MKFLAVQGFLSDLFLLLGRVEGFTCKMGGMEEEISFSNIILPTWMKHRCLSWNSINTKNKWNGIGAWASLTRYLVTGMQKHRLGNVSFNLSVLCKVYQAHGWASTPLIMWLFSNLSGLGRRHSGDTKWVWCRRIRWKVDSWNYGIDLVSIL